MDVMQRNGRRLSTKVDLTAMVDLGFLLITFFMLATTMAKPYSMQLLKPEEDGDPSPYPESKTATLLIGTKDKVYTYSMPDVMTSPSDFVIDSVSYSSTGLRKYIQRRQAEVEAKWGDKEMLYVLIKPLPGAKYKHMIDVLDEMLISDVKRYTILKADTPVDSMVVSLTGETWKTKNDFLK
jgi:biopolymer transport protein ExbD